VARIASRSGCVYAKYFGELAAKGFDLSLFCRPSSSKCHVAHQLASGQAAPISGHVP